MGLHRLSECVRCLQSPLRDLSSSAPASAGPGAAASRGPQDPLCIDESSHLESVRLWSWRGMQCCRRCRKASEFTPGLQPPMVPSSASASAPCQPARCVCLCRAAGEPQALPGAFARHTVEPWPGWASKLHCPFSKGRNKTDNTIPCPQPPRAVHHVAGPAKGPHGFWSWNMK